MRDDPSVIALVQLARDGSEDAWHQLVERYAPLVWRICRRHRLTRTETDDVGGSVWLRLVEHLAELREPAALPGWVATTTAHECLRVLRAAEHERADDITDLDTIADAGGVEWEVLAEERAIVLRAAFAELPDICRQLLTMLLAHPRLTYSQIGSQLHRSTGSIGPTRGRCLDKLREYPALAALIDAESELGGRGGEHG